MKKILMWLTVLALMLTGAAFADQENAPVMLVKLPEDAQMALETVGGYAAKGLMLSVEPEDEEAVRVALVLVSADRCALVYQAVYPQRLGDDQIDDAVQRMVDSMDVLGGSAAKDVG